MGLNDYFCPPSARFNNKKGEEKMKQGHFKEHWVDDGDNPAGGVSTGRGFTISWQNGPLGRGNERKEPNGALLVMQIKML